MKIVRILDSLKQACITLPKTKVMMDQSDIRDLITDEFGILKDALFLDTTYRLVNLSWIVNFLSNESFVDEIEYESESSDCDDFSFILRGEICRLRLGLAVGLAKCYKTSKPDKRHMLNFIVTEDYDIYIVEPQSDLIFKLQDSEYVIEEIII